MWIVLREDLAIIRLVATSAHTFMSNAFISNAFMRKSRLDSPRRYPCCCVAFGARSNGDGNPIFCSLLVVADRRHQLDRGAGPH
jgi:hypothetical protein